VQDSSGYSALHHAALNGHRYGSRRRPRRRCTYVTRCLQGDRQAPAGARRLGQHRRREGVVAAALGRLVGKRRYRQVAAERTIDLQCELDGKSARKWDGGVVVFDSPRKCSGAVVAERLRRLTRNQIPSGSVGSNPTDCDKSTLFLPPETTIWMRRSCKYWRLFDQKKFVCAQALSVNGVEKIGSGK
jgi:hypothetical protein